MEFENKFNIIFCIKSGDTILRNIKKNFSASMSFQEIKICATEILEKNGLSNYAIFRICIFDIEISDFIDFDSDEIIDKNMKLIIIVQVVFYSY